MAQSGPGERTKKRLRWFLLGCAVFFVALIGRLFYIQIIDGERLQTMAKDQWAREFTITAKRGDITDRNGKVLAQSASAATIVGTPKDVSDTKLSENAHRLAEVLGMDAQTIIDKLSDKEKGQQVIKRQVSLETAEQVRALGIKGISINEDTVRAYPQGAFMTQVLGFTKVDGVGQEGLEKSLNKYLAGQNGSIVSQVDAQSRQMETGTDDYIEAKDGYTVVLTTDYVIQAIAEKYTELALIENEAKGAQCIVMNPQTGEILAMTAQPDFDLNSPPRDNLSELSRLMRNSPVADAYEPGSTFKVLTTALALENGVTSLGASYNCSGSVLVDGDKIKCWRSGNPHGHQTLVQAVGNSCNPVFVDLALKMGTDRFYEGLDAFGIGREVPIDMPGAASGQLISIKYVKNVDLARVGFGQSVSVTPIQLLTAACATVNGGDLMKPYIVSKMLDSQEQVVVSYSPEVVGNPISEETSAAMREILQYVVTEGGGRNAYIPGYRVGGKTGTAQKYINGKVSSDVHICSFMGFAPMDNPQVAILLIVDEPGVRPDYGSTVAAPYAKMILEETLKYLGVQTKYGEGEKELEGKTTIVPDVAGLTIQEASTQLTQASLRSMTDGIGDKIVEQLPAAGAQVPEGSLVVLYTEAQGDGQTGTSEQMIEVPDLKGMSMIEANRTLRNLGLTMKINGSGLVVSQNPEAGYKIDPNDEDPVHKRVAVTFQNP